MMIHPTTAEKEKVVRQSAKVIVLYYIVALCLTLLNFITVILYPSPDNIAGQYPAERVVHLLSYCAGLSLPLIFELILDVVFSFFLPALYERKFGHGLLLLSLLLPSIIVMKPKNNLFTLCYVCFCQGIASVAIYGKLQVYGSRWTFWKCIPIIILFVIAQISLGMGAAQCVVKEEFGICEVPRQYVFISFVLYVVCFILQLSFAHKYAFDFYGAHRAGRKWFSGFSADDYVCLILQLIMAFYYFLSFIYFGFSFKTPIPIRQFLSGLILRHIILNLTAAILPGRMVRRDLSVLKKEMQTKETFIRYISHEIRSPLSTTSMGLDYLINKLNDNAINLTEVLEVVNDSKSTCELATQTLNDLLMFDKIQNNMLDIAPTEVDGFGFVTYGVSSFKLQATSSNIALDVHCSSVLSHDIDVESQEELQAIVRIDNYKMDQVLRNLLTNALKFTPRGGTVRVTASVQNGFTDQGDMYVSKDKNGRRRTVKQAVKEPIAGKVFRISVVDNGHGIAKDNLPKLFGQYVQFDADKLQGGKGSGLGLWLSKAIVEMHGGKIGAHSDGLDQGCTFWFELPCELVPIFSNCGSVRSMSVKSLPSTPGNTSSPMMTMEISNDDDEDGHDLNDDIELGQVTEFQVRPKPVKRVSFPVNMNESDEKTPIVSNEFATQEFDNLQSMNEIAPPKSLISQLMKKGGSSHNSNGSLYIKPSVKISSRRAKVGLLKVLLVDDSAIARKMVERSLASIKCMCQHACDGQESVDIIESNMKANEKPFDVILMDYYMPVMNGPEAIVAIRALGYKGIIIAVTGVNTDAEFASLLSVGSVDRVMVKPFRIDTFQTIVHEINSVK